MQDRRRGPSSRRPRRGTPRTSRRITGLLRGVGEADVPQDAHLRDHAHELAVSGRRHRQRLRSVRAEVLRLVDTRLPDLAPDGAQLRRDLVALLDEWFVEDTDIDDTGGPTGSDAS